MDTVAGSEACVEIRVGRNHIAIVDAADAHLVSGRSWYRVYFGECSYAGTSIARKATMMHRLIMQPPADMVVDHINGNGLDNRRSNLRICTRSDNLGNSRKHCKSASIYKGVTWVTRTRRWVAKIDVNKVRYYGGYFKDEVDAAKRYDELAREHFGEFAKTNF